MKYRTVTILTVGFGTLITLISVVGFSVFRRAERIYAEVLGIHEGYRRSAAALKMIQADVYLSSILIRDYLLEPSPAAAGQYRKEFLEIGSVWPKHLASLEPLISDGEQGPFARLRRELDRRWQVLDPVFDWSPEQKAVLGSAFLRNQVIPHRNRVLSIAREIDDLRANALRNEQQKVDESRMDFRFHVRSMFFFSILLALAVAGASIFCSLRLERRSGEQRSRAELAEEELRLLSNRLVQAQEEERKSISRELHDEIGQMLTALRMEVANLERFRHSPGNEFQDHIAETKVMAERTLQSVRDLAMGLRPSMLDDLGLGPALEWQAREFSRRSGIPVTVDSDSHLEGLPESVRTCVYRVAQESLTNCGRHAQAGRIRIRVHGTSDAVYMTVQDDGIGFDPKSPGRRGLGLIGMEERVKKLGGIISISSQAQKGTVLEMSLPLVAHGSTS